MDQLCLVALFLCDRSVLSGAPVFFVCLFLFFDRVEISGIAVSFMTGLF